MKKSKKETENERKRERERKRDTHISYTPAQVIAMKKSEEKRERE